MKKYASKELYLRLLDALKPYWLMFALGILATIVLAVTQPAIAAMMQPLLDGAFVEKDKAYIFWMPILVVILFSLRGISSFLSSVVLAWVSSKVVMDLRVSMFDKLIKLPTKYFDDNSVGKLISKFTHDVTQVTDSATAVLITIVRDITQVIGLIAWMLYIDWKLSLFIFALVPLVGGVVHIIGKRLRVVSANLQNSFGDLNHVLGESIRGQKEVKIFGSQVYEEQRFFSVANWVRRYQMKFQAAAAVGVPIVEVISAIILGLIVYLSTHRIETDSMSVGSFMSFISALGLLLAPIKRLTKVNEPLQKSLAAAESVYTLIDTQAEIDTQVKIDGQDQGLANNLSDVDGEIQFDNVNFKYQTSKDNVVKDFSLTIKPQQTIALVGSSGSGKTTLAQLLPRLYDFNQGDIKIDGKSIKEMPLRTLREYFAMVNQDVILFNDTLAANIAYGSKSEIDSEKLSRAIKAANVETFVKDMPDGVETELGENGVRLSGGQRQRIAIARALYKDAPILILDEATSALDTESESLVQAALENLRKDRTTIIIAHRLSTIKNADVIVVMDKGKIIEQGTHKELLEEQGSYASLHKSDEFS